ncbi:MAG TPA: YIP1 family protein [Pyrinomonadaceae bacterium]|nr:YIP1 family protein [Pyrinomonadaceae bacterium]
MSDPNSDFQAAAGAGLPSPPPPPPPPQLEPAAPRPTKLRPIAIGLFVLGLIALIAGVAKILPGGIFTGLAFVCWGLLLFGLSFIRLPDTATDEPPMSPVQKILGVFYEPTRVFRNLRSHPKWLAAFLVIVIVNIVYSFAFAQRVTPERIVGYTMDKLAESPIKPPPDRMEQARDDALKQATQPVQRVQTAAKTFVGIFVLGAIVAALYLLGVVIFGGRINFWQALAVYFYASLPVILIQKLLSLVILFIKSPDDIHPILNQETMVQDNLGVLFNPADHPVLFVAASVIGVLSFYGLWLRARGLQNGGTKVSSTAAWGATLSVWILWVLFAVALTAVFPSFIS